MGIYYCTIYHSKGNNKDISNYLNVFLLSQILILLGTLTSEERELVKIINEYNDRTLFKLFSKDKSVKDFLEKVTSENTENFIRPYIERRLYKCFTIAQR